MDAYFQFDWIKLAVDIGWTIATIIVVAVMFAVFLTYFSNNEETFKKLRLYTLILAVGYFLCQVLRAILTGGF